MDRRASLGLVLGFVGVLMFGATLPVTRFALADLDPWAITFGRAAVAGVAALALVLASGRPWPFAARGTFRDLAIGSACLVIVFPLLIGLAMQTVPAAHGGVVVGLLPLLTALAAVLFAGERPGAPLFVASATGAALVAAFALRNGGDGGVRAGDMMLFAGVVAAAVGYGVSGRLLRQMAGWEVIAFMLILALPVTLPVALATYPWGKAVSTAALVSVLYLGLFSQFIGFFFWNAGMAMGGVARVGQMQLLQTFVTVGLAWPINGETPDAETLFFALGVVLVVAVAQRVSARKSRGTAVPPG